MTNTHILVPFAFAPMRLGNLRGSRASIGVAMTEAIAVARRAATVIRTMAVYQVGLKFMFKVRTRNMWEMGQNAVLLRRLLA